MCLILGFAIDDPDPTSDPASSSSPFTTENVGYLILSSTLGIIVGDVLWLEALRLLGPKRVIVFDSIRPFGAALLGWAALGEELGPAAYVGMVLAVAGVGIVAGGEGTTADGGGAAAIATATAAVPGGGGDATETETGVVRASVRPDDTARTAPLSAEEGSVVEDRVGGAPAPPSPRDDGDDDDGDDYAAVVRRGRRRVQIRGYACSVANVFADSVGSLLTKMHGGGMTTWSINLIRFGYAGVVLGGISVAMRVRERRRMAASPSSSSSPRSSSGGGKGGTGGGGGGSGGPTKQRRQGDADRGASMDDVDDLNREVASRELPPPFPPRWYELPTLTRRGWLQINAGVALVTFLCPALSNYALFRLALGLAVSLGSVGPLYGLILDWPFKGRRPTVSGCAGALLAVAGVAILCLLGT